MIIDDDREKHEFQEAWLRKRFITIVQVRTSLNGSSESEIQTQAILFLKSMSERGGSDLIRTTLKLNSDNDFKNRIA